MFLESAMLVGVVGIVFGYRAHRSVRALVRERGVSWWRPQIVPLVLGASAFVVTTLVTYPVNDSTRVLGLPFPVAVFEKHGEIWMDFVSPFSFVAYPLNVAFLFLVPQFVVLGWLRRTEGSVRG